MFTGIVEAIGRVEGLKTLGSAHRLAVSSPLDLRRLPQGASIAVNGVCLTVVSRQGRRFEADLGPETRARTNLGGLRRGDRVHLERPLRLGDPLGGHLVTGHIDGRGRIAGRRAQGDVLSLWIAAPSGLARFLAAQGSVAVDGISLTVNEVRGARFRVGIIPHTLAVTCLGERRVGDRVNIETDVIAKHVARLIESHVR